MREQFDCYDFYLWSMGKHYNFSEYIVPWGVSLLPPDIETLIDEHQKEKEF